MAGYTRVDTGNNIADGNVISAADLDNEFDGIQAAFNANTGHNHDGTTGEGAPILVLGPTQDVVVGASTVTPKTTNTVDIGSSSLKFKDLYMAGNASIGGTLAVTGVATLTAQPILSSLTASRAVFTDGSKGLVSNAITGTGNVVMSASPTLTGTITAEALTTSSTVTLNGGTANGVAYLNGSKVLTTGSALTFDGAVLLNAQASAASGVLLNLQNTTTGSFMQFSMPGVANTRFGSPNADAFVWQTFGIGAYPEQMRLTSTGLGIGTSSPGAKLNVVTAGTALANFTGAQYSQLRHSDGTRTLYTQVYDNLAIFGTESNTPLSFVTNSTVKATIDSSGNLGLGVTPSAWLSNRKVIEVGGSFSVFSGSANTGIYNNAYTNTSSVDIYKNTGVAAQALVMGSTGGFAFYTAPSGTAGNAISFTQAMTLDASGNLLLGTTSSDGSRLRVFGAYQTLGDGAYEGLVGKASSLVSGGGSGDFAIRSAANLVFATNGNSERARIDSSGNLLVGKTADVLANTGCLLDARGSFTFTRSGAPVGYINRLASDGEALVFMRSTTQVGSISVTTSATAYNTSSDYRLKENIAPMTGALAKVAQLKPVTYTWKADGSAGEGFIAHELAEVCPAAVTGEKDAVDADGKPQYQGIDVSFLVGTLTAAIQELKAEFDAYKASHP